MEYPVHLEVNSGYSCLGSFLLYMRLKEGNVELFPEKEKVINDNIIDFFMLPYTAEELCDLKLYIFGKYAPAPGHEQILVSYDFFQHDEALVIEPDKSNIIEEKSNDFAKSFYHSFNFKCPS
jgi:hypothetical protein